MSLEIYTKYLRPSGRYTYFPFISQWDAPMEDHRRAIEKEYLKSYDPEIGIDLYIHIPFCRSLCSFCGLNIKVTESYEYVKKYFSSLLEEWNFYLQIIPNSKINSLTLGGGTPNFLKPESLDFLLSSIFQKTTVSSSFKGIMEIDPRFLDKQILSILKKWKFNTISMGVQDFSTKIVKNLNREHHLPQLLNTISLVQSQVKFINLDLIYGLPLQSKELFLQGLRYIKTIKPSSIALYPLAKARWQQQAQNALGLFVLPSIKETYDIFFHANKFLTSLNYRHLGFGHYYKHNHPLVQAFKAKTLQRNVMGFTTKKSSTLIGLGVSGLSFVGDYFYQNNKIFEKYLSDPCSVEKAHHRTKLEKMFDPLIEKLLSHKAIDLYEYFHLLHPPKTKSSQDILDALEELKRDKLIHLEKYQLTILPKGVEFYKNIFQELDPYPRIEIPESI